jgi:carboxypeptidase Taq
MLHWDHAAMMPDGGAAARSRQIATLEGLAHGMLVDAALTGLLDEAEAAAGLDPWDAANLREMRRAWRHARAVPADLVEALSVAASECETAWREARPADDFGAVAPLLDTVLRLTREQAAAKAAAFGCAPYDALLDAYEPGGTAARIDALFAGLAAVLPDLHDRALARQGAAPVAAQGPFPVEAQRALGVEVMGVLGFDFRHGRLDRSHHPFTGGVPDDVRLTTRYHERDFLRGLLGTVHETGHALYEQGLPAAWRRQPVGDARGMVLHESQSLLMEMQVARGDAFLGFLAPLLARALGPDPAFRPDNLARLTRRVARGLIRVDADEIAYPLHVMLRYRLERALLAGDLAIGDLPGAWNDGMRDALGVVPPDDRDGCMQDVHWFSGAFGYFPTYTLGALAAAQLFAAAGRAITGLPDALARGEVAPLLAWLRAEVHGRASSASTDAVLESATGAPLETAAYLAHIEARYLS